MIDFGPRIDALGPLERTRAAARRLLAELASADWARPTICQPWLVRDIVAHLIGGDLARLSRTRDGWPTERPAPGQSLPVFLDSYNQQWVDAAARISPALLGELLDLTTPLVLRLWRTADLDALGEPVSWADPGPAPRWMDCARELTEFWTHLHQILDATGRPPLADDDALHTVLDTFLRALPRTLLRAGTEQPLTLAVSGPAGGSWTVVPTPSGWTWTTTPPPATTTVTLDPESLWRLCTRGISYERAMTAAHIDGDHALAAAALTITSIIH